MTLEEFNSLDDAAKSAALAAYDALETTNADLTAERDSYKEENDNLKSEIDANKKELQETKKLNFTLARKADKAPSKSFDETLLDAMGIKRKE